MKKVLAIVGPTASGKTDISIKAAEALGGEIISADSRQVYKNIPIATSQPTQEQLALIPHYFIGELELNEEFNAGEFGKAARNVIEDIFSRNKLPVIEGGSGLYIKSLIDGLFEEEIESDEVRKNLYEKLEREGENSLYEELLKVDPESFEIIPRRKIRRVIRALEVFYSTGKKISELHKSKSNIGFETVRIGITYERKILYQRINERVDKMIKQGLIEEVIKLKEAGYHYKTNYSLDTVGVKEVFKYLEGEYDSDEMIFFIKQNTRRYAKRQLTWFRKDKSINWIEASPDDSTAYLAEKIVELWKTR